MLRMHRTYASPRMALHLMQTATEATEREASNAVAWALLSLLYRADGAPGNNAATAARNAAHRAQELAECAENNNNDKQDTFALAQHPFLQLEIVLLELQLGDLAQIAHEHAAAAPGVDAAGVKSALVTCKAHAASLCGNVDVAVKVLTSAAKSERAPHHYTPATLSLTCLQPIRGQAFTCMPALLLRRNVHLFYDHWRCVYAAAGSTQRGRALVLLGHTQRRAGNVEAATAAYEAALHNAPAACPLDVYLRLGHGYLAAGSFEHAANVFGQACAACPCAAAWLGAGIAAARLGNLEGADLALAEANAHDCRNAQVWAWLALVHALAGRHEESAQVCLARLLQCARRAQVQPEEFHGCMQSPSACHAKMGPLLKTDLFMRYMTLFA